MTAVVITPPDPVVSVEEALAHLRIDHTDDNVLIEGLIAAATQYFDGPKGILGRAIGEQTIELRLDEFPTTFVGGRLPYPPLISVDDVFYVDADGEEQALADDAYIVFGEGSDGAWISVVSGGSWPLTSDTSEAVKVQYTAGYVAGEIPAPIRIAILMTVAHWYENRETVAAVQMHEVPWAAEILVSPYRLIEV